MNQPRGRNREPPQGPPGGFDPLLDSHYGSSSSNGDIKPRRKRAHRDDLKDSRIEAPKFDGSLKPEGYLEWVQAMVRIIEIKGYS